MKISNCSYCGLLAITNEDVCESCESLFSPDDQDSTQSNETELPPMVESSSISTSSTPDNESLWERSQNRNQFSDSDRPIQTDSKSNCLRCGIPIDYGLTKCFECENKKFPAVKVSIVFAVLAILIGTFSFSYIYESFSPWGIYGKYAKATGADDSIIFENFSFKGEARVMATIPSKDPKSFESSLSVSNVYGQQGGEKFSFEMVYKKPNMTSIEFTRGSQTVLKQVFDGTLGWKYTNMPNQPVGYQDTDDAFGLKKMGMGLEEYDSMEFLDDKIKAEYGEENIAVFSGLKTFDVEGIKKDSKSLVIVQGRNKKNGKDDKSLLIFDQETGFLIGMMRKDMVNNSPVVTTILFNNYKKYLVNKQSYLWVSNDYVLIPTKTTFVMKQTGSIYSIVIELNIEKFNIDVPIDDKVFVKPQS